MYLNRKPNIEARKASHTFERSDAALYAYVHKDVEALLASRKERPPRKTTAPREPLQLVARYSRSVDLDALLAKWWALQPAALKNRPYTLEELLAVPAFVGRTRGRAVDGDMAAALRNAGWKSVRLYRNGYGGRRYWMPPELAPNFN